MRKVFQTATHVLQGVSGQSWLPIHKVTLQHGRPPRPGVPEAPGGWSPEQRHFPVRAVYCVPFYPLHCWGFRSLWRWRIYSCWEVYSFHGSLPLPQPGRKCLPKQGCELGFFINAVRRRWRRGCPLAFREGSERCFHSVRGLWDQPVWVAVLPGPTGTAKRKT